jgi:glutathione S-transferase
MSAAYVFYAWPLSYYSGKTRAYLRYKAIPHRERPLRVWTFKTIKKKTGATVMPVVVTPEGEWLQDTSHIMDVLEQRFPAAGVVPSTPRQRVAAYLLEAWGDEFWLPSAMHYRWSFPENFETLFQPEGGDHLLPFAPRFIKNRLIATGARQMRGFLPGLGVVPAQLAAIEAWTVATLDHLDAHFAEHPYLLGTRPSYGDFGLIGPLYAHLGRDPVPRRVLMEPRPHLAAWIARMQSPPQPGAGAFLGEDRIPATLAPIFRSIFAEFWPYLERTQAEVGKALPALNGAGKLRRALGEIEFPLGASTFRRAAAPFSLWMAQRPLDAYRALTPAERTSVDEWLQSVGGGNAMQLSIVPRLKRIGLHVAPE